MKNLASLEKLHNTVYIIVLIPVKKSVVDSSPIKPVSCNLEGDTLKSLNYATPIDLLRCGKGFNLLVVKPRQKLKTNFQK